VQVPIVGTGEGDGLDSHLTDCPTSALNQGRLGTALHHLCGQVMPCTHDLMLRRTAMCACFLPTYTAPHLVGAFFSHKSETTEPIWSRKP
jgi:hypothetical protein